MSIESTRNMLVKAINELAVKHVKTHHLTRDGFQLCRTKTTEREVCVSKHGSKWLLKLTMPVDALPKKLQGLFKAPAQARHMSCALELDKAEAVQAIEARIRSTKTSTEYSVDVYGTERAPCWTKYEKAKERAALKAKTSGPKKVKATKKVKAAKKVKVPSKLKKAIAKA